tara:strand:- start:326 stop:901 length:576 start_codon:yes stop_codon:yes gene_type:complete
METENTPKTIELTEQEKKYLENYNEENPFLKSLSDNYKEKGSLTEKQILALRKDADKEKNRLNRCPNTNLNLKQTCAFVDQNFNEKKLVIVNAIRPKALCITDNDNNVYAWMPSKAVEVREEMDESDEIISVLTLKSWFDRSDDFWKQSKPLEKPIQEETPEPPAKEGMNTTFTPEEIDDVYNDHKEDLPF